MTPFIGPEPGCAMSTSVARESGWGHGTLTDGVKPQGENSTCYCSTPIKTSLNT